MVPTIAFLVQTSLHEASRRAVPQKAWTSGMNPITQRSTTPGQQNGAGVQNKASQKTMPNENAHSAEKTVHERLLYLFANFMVMIYFSPPPKSYRESL